MQISRIFSLAGFLTWEGRGGRFLCARFLPPSTGGPQPREKIGGVFKKSLEFLRGIDIESNRFFARRGKAPRLPAGQQGAMRKIVNTNSSTI